MVNKKLIQKLTKNDQILGFILHQITLQIGLFHRVQKS